MRHKDAFIGEAGLAEGCLVFFVLKLNPPSPASSQFAQVLRPEIHCASPHGFETHGFETHGWERQGWVSEGCLVFFVLKLMSASYPLLPAVSLPRWLRGWA